MDNNSSVSDNGGGNGHENGNGGNSSPGGGSEAGDGSAGEALPCLARGAPETGPGIGAPDADRQALQHFSENGRSVTTLPDGRGCRELFPNSERLWGPCAGCLCHHRQESDACGVALGLRALVGALGVAVFIGCG